MKAFLRFIKQALCVPHRWYRVGVVPGPGRLVRKECDRCGCQRVEHG